MLIDTKSSSKLETEFVFKYSNINPINKNVATGYKLVLDQIENYYSIGTGLYRYKTGRVKRKSSDYSNLYRDTEFFTEEMVDRVAIFKSIEDLEKMYPTWKDCNSRISIIKFEISGDIIELDATNEYGTVKVFAGKNVNSIKRP